MTDRVIVAGGGPAGLMLACELRLAGIPVTVFEREAERGEDSQGMAIHGRSLEVLRQRGIAGRIPADEIFAWPRTPFGFFWLDMDAVAEEEYTYAFPQWKTERLLERRAVELGADLRLGHEVTGVEQDADGVTVEVRTANGTDRLRGAYLVGCDGARSAVRELAGIGFPSGGLTYYGVLGDVTLTDGPHDQFDTGLFPTGMFGALPLKAGELRLMTIEFGVEPPEDGGPVTPGELRAAIARVTGTEPALDRARWMSRFGGSTRLADAYRRDRVFLAGDAAHVLYISGSQGMNAGIQDAVNLGWKLAARIHGWAPDGLLDSYEAERRPAGERMVLHARAQMALMHPLERIAPFREVFGELLESSSDVNRHLLEMATVFRYPYADDAAHPLVGREVPNVSLKGPDAPEDVAATLHTGHGVLLDLSGGAADLGWAADWAGRVDVVRAERAEEIDAVTLLVRPDGRVAHAERAGAGPDGLRGALTTWFGEPGPAR